MLRDEPGIEVVGEASSGEEAVQFARTGNVDIVLMDLRMPGIGGLEAIRKIKRPDDGIGDIAVTAAEDDPAPSRVMQAGGAADVTKGDDIQELVKAIRAVNAAQRYISPDIAQKLALRPYQPEADKNVFERLSEREMQIAMMIVNCQKVQEISDKLCLSPKTVNSYRYRIFDKLEISSDVELTLLSVRHGMLDAERIE